VIDTREMRVAVDPVAMGKGNARAAEIARRYGVSTSVHQELVRRPAGTIVARSGSTTIAIRRCCGLRHASRARR